MKINSILAKIEISETELKKLKYSNKLYGLVKNSKALNNEISFVRKKIVEIKSEINQLENNLQFFSKVKDDNPMILDVKSKIENHKNELKEWNQKLSTIKKIIH